MALAKAGAICVFSGDVAVFAGYSGIVSISAALVGKKGTRVWVVIAALLIELSNFAAVSTD